MKEWFPFTNYDFYGYLASGLILLCVIDYWFSGGQMVTRTNWTFLQGALVIAVGYVTGQVIAIPASIILETFVARKLLLPPATLLLKDKAVWFDRLIGKFLIGRYYAPLPPLTRKKILDRTAAANAASSELRFTPEEVFITAFRYARRSDDSRRRIDDFRNQYGFSRNMAMTCFVSAALMFERNQRVPDDTTSTLMVLALLIAIGMMIRFLKFYSSFAAEILTAYAYDEDGRNEN